MSDIEILEVINHSLTNGKQSAVQAKKKRKRKSSGLIEKSESLKGTETVFDEFIIDRTTTPQRKLTVKQVQKSDENSGNSSRWRKSLESTLLGFVPQSDPDKNLKIIPNKRLCFNCDGDHNLRDCPRPKDFRRIDRKRKAGDVYHRKQLYNNNGGISKQKERNFKPGVMSETLRKALGLQTNEIPEHVYRMRKLGFIKGYPPGWLRKAIKSTDTIKLYSSEATNDKKESAKPPELDSSKIAWFLGFNEHSSKLKDREHFKIPPKNQFCSIYQDELIDSFYKAQKHEKEISRKTPKYKAFMEEETDDIIVIEDEDIAKKINKFNMPGESGVVTILNGKQVDVTESIIQARENVKIGESMFEIIGTPVLSRSHLSPVAPLEAFAVGIQPFEANECATNKGIFRKLMEKLREVRHDGVLEKTEESKETVLEIDEDVRKVQTTPILPTHLVSSFTPKQRRKTKKKKSPKKQQVVSYIER